MNYSLGFDGEAKESLGNLSPQTKRDVNKVLKRLRFGTDPALDQPLKRQGNLWRSRASRGWRVIFEVQPGRHIQIKRIRRRVDAYTGIEHPDTDFRE